MIETVRRLSRLRALPVVGLVAIDRVIVSAELGSPDARRLLERYQGDSRVVVQGS